MYSSLSRLFRRTLFPVAAIVVVLVAAGLSRQVASLSNLSGQPLISDQSFVFHPDLFGFDVGAYLREQNSGLASYSEPVDGTVWTAAEIIENIAHFYSISPRVLLTLVELQTAAVSAASPDRAALERAFGFEEPGFHAQLDAAAQTLFSAYYDFKRDDTERARWPEGINAGSVAIARFVTETTPTDEARDRALSRDAGSFYATFNTLFGDPLAGNLVNQPPPGPMAGARLPWTPGETWNYNSGPHAYNGGTVGCAWGAAGCPGTWSSVDFGPMRPVGCTADQDGDTYLSDFVVATKDGEVTYGGEKGAVKITHSDGWITYYVHLAQEDLVQSGPIKQGDPIGHPSCQGNTSGIHLHFAINYGGEFQNIDGTNLSGWTLAKTTHYNGLMTCPDGRMKTADTRRLETSKIADDCRPPAAASLSVVLIIDSTGSMASNDPRRLRVEAAKAFIDASQPGDEIGIVDFQTSGRVLAPMTVIQSDTEKNSLKSAVDRVYNGGSTNINAGLNTGFATLSAAAGTGQKRAAILLTDGGHNTGGPYNDRSHLQYADQGWSVYTVGLGQADLTLLARIANATGGTCVNNCRALTDPAELGRLYQDLRSALTNSTPVANLQFPIQQGQQRSVPANVNPNQFRTQFYISWEGSEMELTLIAPGGQIIGPGNLPPNVRHAKGATYELYHVDFPQPGLWTMSVYGKEVPPGGELVNAYAATQGLSYLYVPFSEGVPAVPPTATPVPPTLTPEPDLTPTPTATATPPSPPDRAWRELPSGSATGGGISQTTAASSRPSITYTAGDSLYIAWTEQRGDQSDIYVRRWNGSAWVEAGAGAASGGGVSNTSGISEAAWIDGAPDGSLYLAWHEAVNGNYDIYVKRWNGSAWVEAGAGSASGGGISSSAALSEWPAIGIAPDGTVYVAWREATATDTEIYVKRWNGSAWVEAGAGSASGGGISDNPGDSGRVSITFSSDGTPHLGWTDASSGDTEVYIRRFDGNAWVEAGTGSASGGGISNNAGDSRAPVLAADAIGGVFAAWPDNTGGNFDIYVMRWNGSAWVEAGAGSASGGGISGTTAPSIAPHVAVGPDNTPYVVWYENPGANTEIFIKRWNGSAWTEAGPGSASGGGISANSGISSLPSLTVTGTNTPLVAWTDNTSGNYEIYLKAWMP